jgi:hypothetical protein
MSTNAISNALRARIRGQADHEDTTSNTEQAAIRTWERRQKQARAHQRPITAPSGAIIWF